MVRTVLSCILGLTLGLAAVSPAAAKSPAAKAPAAKAAAAKPGENIITIVGEAEPPAGKKAPKVQPVDDDDELLESLFNPPEVKAVKTLPAETTLTPPGSPPVTAVPAGPGEAKVEKSGQVKSAQAAERPARKQIAAAAAGPDYARAGLDSSDPDYRRWALATRNWQRVGAVTSSQSGGFFQVCRVTPLDQAVIPSAGLRPGQR